MNKPTLVLSVLLGGVLAGVAWLRWPHGPAPAAARNSAMAVLTTTAGNEGFARAEQPRLFVFPRDHALHEDFRSEWWYFTGHLHDQDGHPFGFQLTLFRFELAATSTPSNSAWRTPRLLLGHFALTDIDGQVFHQFERLSRALPALAGASVTPPAVWLDDWRVTFDDAAGAWHVQAAQDDIGLSLSLTPHSAIVAQGDGGLSRKSAAPGNASYYYSVPRLTATGTVTLTDGRHAVSGSAWLDREWSTSALAREQTGWDWFALQLDDGSSLMFYRLRQRDGSADPHSAGSFVSASGVTRTLGQADVDVQALGSWHSDTTGRTYPQRWRLRIPALALDFTLAPSLPDQEWHGRFRYWEGAVTVMANGTSDARPTGRGYVELTGY